MLTRCAPFLAVVCALMAWSDSASALPVAPGTGWAAAASAYPTNLPPGGSGDIQIDIVEAGALPSSGPITVTDTLPLGVTATNAGGMREGAPEIFTPEEEESEFGGARWVCTGNGSGERNIVGAAVVTCTSNPGFLAHLPTGPPNEEPEERIGIAVKVDPATSERVRPDCTVDSSFCNHVTVAGGGASGATSASDPVTISSSQPGFGFSDWDVSFTNADGTPDTQAGSHPYQMTLFLGLNELKSRTKHTRMADGEIRNLDVDLPPGLFGDANATPRCTRGQLDGGECPRQTQVGLDSVGVESEGGGGKGADLVVLGVYNMIPPPGVPVEFAISFVGFNAFFDAGVRSDGGYGLVEHIDNITRASIDQNILTLWGVPQESSHDAQRSISGGFCVKNCASGILPRPLLTLPTSCVGPQAFTVRGLATWQDPSAHAEATVLTHDGSGAPVGFTGCEHLSMEPSLSAVPDTSFADTPAGLTADLKVPQETLSEPDALVASTLKDTTVTLPEGVVVNPGQAAGLVACQAAEANVSSEGPASCPAASKVGTVKIKTPLLEGTLESELEGDVYVLQSNPPNLQLLLTASADGIFLKLVGDVHLNETTGQLTTTFTETPELPFSDLKVSFSGGAQAALATPTGCGIYTTTSDLTPWTTPFGEDVLGSSSFQITSGPGGSACASPLPFSPSMTAGSTTDQAGGFTNFSLLLQNGDGQQRIEKLQFKEPAGMAGMISQVPLCPEPQAAQGACSSASQIGHAIVASGPGPFPLIIPEPGRPPAPIYLTGPYKGAPFGLSIVTPVIAGPFNLGTIVTRASIAVDPHTAQITVTTDPLPQIIDGVPTDLRTINSVIDRPGFLFNPTNCNPMSFSGTATSAQGASAAISSPFQVGSCQSLAFKPDFKVSTSGKTSKANGASLDAKILYPTGSPGYNQASSQANVARVKVDLPKQLPSRLTTLQRACTAAQFEANPAGCPAASIIGHATAITPVLPVPVSGPAYFVSHGGEAFPSLIMVLQGYGVTVELEGTTFISKAGITSSTFKQVPDVPITSFDLNLPQGKFSALAANGNLCTSKLVMPTEFVGQNGAVIHQNTPISVTGCAKKKSLTRSQKLAMALKVCHKKAKGHKRSNCERVARKRYGAINKNKKKK